MWQNWTPPLGGAMATRGCVRDSGSSPHAIPREWDWRRDCNMAGDRMRRASSGTGVSAGRTTGPRGNDMTTNGSTRTGTVRLARTLSRCAALCAIVCSGLASAAAPGQTRTVTQQVAPSRAAATQAAAPNVGADYQLGPTDVISVVVWGEKDLSTEVVIRPDGKISLPLINDVEAAGLTTEQLRRRITELAKRFVETPVVTVVVKQVNNNRAFVTGQVMRPGPYVLSGPTTVLQIIALAGGFTEFADKNHVLITRLENGRQQAFEFNYTQVIKKRDLSQNLILKPGDTVVVP